MAVFKRSGLSHNILRNSVTFDISKKKGEKEKRRKQREERKGKKRTDILIF